MKDGYSIAALRGDLLGGLTAGIVALPLALAFGVASGAGAVAGLYGAIALGLFASLFGGTPTQVSGPTGPMTVIFAAAVVAFPGDMDSIFTIVFFSGVMQIAFGYFKLGTLVRFMPYPVISGFMSGIGVIIILLELNPLLGLPGLGSPVAAAVALPHVLMHANTSACLLSLLTVLIVFLTPARISRSLPSPLIALIVGTVVSLVWKMDVSTIGDIPQTLPDIHLPHCSLIDLPRIIGMAVALALLGTIDSLLTSVVADSMTKTRHKPNRELFGQGLGNIAAALIGGLPGAGATMRTVVNIKAGGTTRVSGVTHGLVLLAILLGLGQYASHIPQPVLAGILMKVGIDILDYRLLRMIRTVPKTDLLVMCAVFLITVFVDLIEAVGVGITLASLMTTWRIAKQSRINIEGTEGGEYNNEVESQLQQETNYQIRTVTVEGAFFFGTTAKMQEHVSKLMGTKVVIINCQRVPFMDLSGLYALSEMIDRLKSEEIKPLLVMPEDKKLDEQILKLGLGQMLGNDGIHYNYEDALQLAFEYISDD
jgi:SulP family sulfate permease